MSRLDAELVNLFGKQVVEQSQKMRLDDLAQEAELVAEAARQLREASGNTQQQRAIVRAMSEDAALALCRWIKEPGLFADVKFVKVCG